MLKLFPHKIKTSANQKTCLVDENTIIINRIQHVMRGNKEQQNTSDNVCRRAKNWQKLILHRTLLWAVVSIYFDEVMQNVATFNAKD